MPLPLQTRLLRVLAEAEFFRVGGRELIRVDVRVVAATHQDLDALVAAGRFRADLLHRLDVVRLHLPPLRERRDDVPTLADAFLAAAAQRFQAPVKRLDAGARERLRAHDWPGNVRELALYAERRLLGLDADHGPDIGADRPLPERVAAFEARALATALIQAAGDATQARARLGLPRKTFYDKIKRHGLDLRAFRGKDRPKT